MINTIIHRVPWLGAVVVGAEINTFTSGHLPETSCFCRRAVDVLVIGLPPDYDTEPESRCSCASSPSAGLISLRCPHEYFY